MLAVVSALSISLQGLQVFGADSAETAAKPASARVEPAVKTAAAGTAASVPASVAKPKGSYIKEEPLTDPARLRVSIAQAAIRAICRQQRRL
jgi:hypothetical protein